MIQKQLQTYAPMPIEDETIKKNSMKLYSYLMCIAGLAKYPQNTRMFRQKNLVLTQIQRATGITDKTAKLYMYYLEANGLIQYRGEVQQEWINPCDYLKATDYRKAAEVSAAKTWKLRNKTEKEGVYHIPRPNPYTQVPEITLEKLNKYGATEEEVKIYLVCCAYRDICCYNGQSFKIMKYEDLREILGFSQQSFNNKKIRKSMLFLKGLGLIDFEDGSFCNSKLMSVPCFKLKDVDYYITLEYQNWFDDNTISQSEINELTSRFNSVKTQEAAQ